MKKRQDVVKEAKRQVVAWELGFIF